MRKPGIVVIAIGCLCIGLGMYPVKGAIAEEYTDALCLAAAKGDNIQVRHLLHSGYSADDIGEDGPAMVYAAEQGHLSTITLLMGAGAHIGKCDDESLFGHYNRALWHAASEGHREVVRYLLDKKANKDGQDDNGYTPLLAAAAGSHLKTVRLLLDYGADPNYQTRHANFSALMLAAEAGNKDTVRLLLRHGADANAEDRYEQNVLWYARHNGRRLTAQILRRAGAKG